MVGLGLWVLVVLVKGWWQFLIFSAALGIFLRLKSRLTLKTIIYAELLAMVLWFIASYLFWISFMPIWEDKSLRYVFGLSFLNAGPSLLAAVIVYPIIGFWVSSRKMQ
jgi:hypothetical protein